MKKQFWVNKYEVVGIKPGTVVVPGIGSLNLADESLPLEKIQKAYDAGCPYLKPIVKNSIAENAEASDESQFPKTVKEVMDNLDKVQKNKKKASPSKSKP